MIIPSRIILPILVFICICYQSFAQRSYKSSSVLASGNWYKISVADPGVYKLDVSFLTSIGINISGFSSTSLRLYGNGGGMLSEACSSVPVDDLFENPLFVSDGGDGILNGADFCLFYAPGPDSWLKDSVNKSFSHQKNIYSDSSFYFLTVGGTGKRIGSLPGNLTPNLSVTAYDARYFYESDLINLISSGKEWFGEEFTNAPGKTLSKEFSASLPGLINILPVKIVSDCIARSVNAPSRFDLLINGQPIQQIPMAATGSGPYDLFATKNQVSAQFNASSPAVTLRYVFVPGSFNAQGWLNYFELHGRSNLALTAGNQLLFRDWNSVGNNICEFSVANASAATQIWEITEPLSPLLMNGNFTQGVLRFVNDASRLREYIAFNPADARQPVYSGRVVNQDLHQSSAADYLIVTHPILMGEAERLASFHRQKNNLQVKVVTTSQVYNEFSSGSPDPSAVRDFAKMYYDKALLTQSAPPGYLLLFGDASFDYKNRISANTNLVPAYQSAEVLDPLNTYTSDDFFGFLDDHEDINSGLVTNLLDIGIGRIPAKNIAEAANYVDKIITYHQQQSLGSWRNIISFIADDEDNNLHFDDAELITGNISSASRLLEIKKIYLDAFPQESGSGGSNYPEANQAISNRVTNGTMILNYIGHGGASRLAEEAVIDFSAVNGWKNERRLPLVVTATCDFAPYDNPFISSLGENMLIRPQTGAIALVTTTRLVFSFSNRIMNDNFMQVLMKTDSNGLNRSMGKAIRDAKNFTYQTSGDITNNRKFTLLGDPALTLSFPVLKIKTTVMNQVQLPSQPDTISAGEKVVIEGEIVDTNGVIVNDFNGTIMPVVYDKPREFSTRGNDPGSIPAVFRQYADILFRGKATVQEGKFRFEFKLPKDINYFIAPGRISYYAENGVVDANGYFEDFMVGGSTLLADNDKDGPEIRAWLNDEKFVNGGITNQNPVLLLKLVDSSGINTTGTGIGHDITFTIDNDNSRVYVLNDFYEADLDNFQKGSVRFQLPFLEPGFHTIKIRAWDVLNNSSEFTLDLQVVNDEELTITHILNYPNPFTTSTTFWFEHNKPGEELTAQVQIFTVSGRVIKTLKKTIFTTGNRFCDIEWDGRDESGSKIGRGVYLYKLKVSVRNSKPKFFIEKLVVL